MTELNDQEQELVKVLVNQSIHELVFALQHVEQGDADDALNCLVLVREHASRVAGIIEALIDRPCSLQHH